uniref:Uncharacterized protein n=1 Tax=Romanomermis culicivorax TaxID=13658 RepID=A0A915HIV6_ROMCU
MANQELVTQLHELKTRVEALFDIITNAATEDKKREAQSHYQEQERQIMDLLEILSSDSENDDNNIHM